MTSQNLELAQTVYSEWERGDYASSYWQEGDIEFVVADGPEPFSGVGAKGLAKGWAAFLSAWEGFRHEAEDYLELTGDRVLVLTRFHGRAKVSKIEASEVGSRAAVLFDFTDGFIRRITLYFDRERALAELGLGSR